MAGSTLERSSVVYWRSTNHWRRISDTSTCHQLVIGKLPSIRDSLGRFRKVILQYSSIRKNDHIFTNKTFRKIERTKNGFRNPGFQKMINSHRSHLQLYLFTVKLVSHNINLSSCISYPCSAPGIILSVRNEKGRIYRRLSPSGDNFCLY